MTEERVHDDDDLAQVEADRRALEERIRAQPNGAEMLADLQKKECAKAAVGFLWNTSRAVTRPGFGARDWEREVLQNREHAKDIIRDWDPRLAGGILDYLEWE